MEFSIEIHGTLDGLLHFPSSMKFLETRVAPFHMTYSMELHGIFRGTISLPNQMLSNSMEFIGTDRSPF